MYDENIKLAKQKGKVLFLSSTPLYKEEMQIIGGRLKQNGKSCIYQYHVGQYLPDWHPWDMLEDFFVSDKKTNGCREILAIELPWIQAVFGKIENINVLKANITSLKLDFPDVYVIQMQHSNGSIGNLTVDVVSRQAVRRLEIFNEDIYIRWMVRQKHYMRRILKPIRYNRYLPVGIFMKKGIVSPLMSMHT